MPYYKLQLNKVLTTNEIFSFEILPCSPVKQIWKDLNQSLESKLFVALYDYNTNETISFLTLRQLLVI